MAEGFSVSYFFSDPQLLSSYTTKITNINLIPNIVSFWCALQMENFVVIKWIQKKIPGEPKLMFNMLETVTKFQEQASFSICNLFSAWEPEHSNLPVCSVIALDLNQVSERDIFEKCQMRKCTEEVDRPMLQNVMIMYASVHMPLLSSDQNKISPQRLVLIKVKEKYTLCCFYNSVFKVQGLRFTTEKMVSVDKTQQCFNLGQMPIWDEESLGEHLWAQERGIGVTLQAEAIKDTKKLHKTPKTKQSPILMDLFCLDIFTFLGVAQYFCHSVQLAWKHPVATCVESLSSSFTDGESDSTNQLDQLLLPPTNHYISEDFQNTAGTSACVLYCRDD